MGNFVEMASKSSKVAHPENGEGVVCHYVTQQGLLLCLHPCVSLSPL